jgi:hypothetical protein
MSPPAAPATLDSRAKWSPSLRRRSSSATALVICVYFACLTFAAVSCPAPSTGLNVPAGCACNAGYAGIVRPIGSAPFYSANCTGMAPSAVLLLTSAAVPCPALSSGASVPAGCTCNAGMSGTISANSSAPFFASTCQGKATHMPSCVSSISIRYRMPRQQHGQQHSHRLRVQRRVFRRDQSGIARAVFHRRLQWYLILYILDSD